MSPTMKGSMPNSGYQSPDMIGSHNLTKIESSKGDISLCKNK